MAGWGQDIREARERRSWTQAELAERLNTSTGTVSRWENEQTKPSIDQINMLSAALGMSTDVFVEKLGLRLTPIAAARLPRRLVEALLRLTPEQQDALATFFLGGNGQS